MKTALQWPRMMVATDALPAINLAVKTNPNVAGTFSRVLGHYVRDTKLLSLSDALARMSLYQAQWLSQSSAAFDKKGRIQMGSDADIVIFDPELKWKYNKKSSLSLATNTPFENREFKGKVEKTFVEGKLVFGILD